MKDPQEPEGMQLQVTPPLAESFATVAAMVAVALVASDAGGAVVRVTVIPEAGLMVMAGEVALIAVLVTEVAVIVTVPEGTVAGAV